MKKGRAGTMTHDYKRNGTTTLFAALNVLGTVIGRNMQRNRHQEFECRGMGSPTVVLIAGGWEAGWLWTYALEPGDPVHALPYDAVGLGEGNPQKLDTAVFPAVAKFTRVCLYDRPNTAVGWRRSSAQSGSPTRLPVTTSMSSSRYW